MAKKHISGFPSLLREDKEWGTRLLLHPFPGDSNYMGMEIQADIDKPTPARKLTCVKIRFTGVPPMTPFNAGQTRIWMAALESVANAAKAVEEDETAGTKRKSPAKRRG